jgi:hypothetical protein
LATDEDVQNHVLDICESVPHVAAQAWSELSAVAAERGDLTFATRYQTRAAELWQELGDRWQVALAAGRQADYLVESEPTRAAKYTIKALTILRDMAAQPNLVYSLETAAGLFVRSGQPARAATILGAIHDAVARDDTEWDRYRRPMLGLLRSLLSDAAYSREVRRGQRLGIRGATDTAINWLAELSPDG